MESGGGVGGQLVGGNQEGMAAGQQDMQTFVRHLFQGSPDLSILTHAIVRKKYLLHTGQESLSKQEKEQLKQLVEEELVQMQIEDSPRGGMTEVQDSVKSGGQKRPHSTSDISGGEARSKQKKKQRTEQELEVSSNNEDSGIDSKKLLRHGDQKGVKAEKCKDSFELEDSGPEDHTVGYGSDGQSKKNKRKKPPWKSSRGRSEGNKTKERQRDKSGSESEAITDLSDFEEKTGKCRKATKGLATESESDSEQELRSRRPQKRQEVDNKQNGSGSEPEGKNRKIAEQRRNEGSESDEGSEPPQVRKTGKKDRRRNENEKRKIRTEKKPNKCWSLWKSEEDSESEQECGSSSEDGKARVRKKTANSQHRKENKTTEESGSSSDSSEEGSHKEEEVSQRIKSTAIKEKCNYKSVSGSEEEEEEEELKIQFGKGRRSGLSRNNLEKKQEKKQKVLNQKKCSSSEESESEMDKPKALKPRKKETWKSSGSECSSESEAEDSGKGERKSKKMPTSSNKEGCEGGNPKKRKIVKKQSKDVCGSESSDEGSLKKGGAEKSQTSVGNMESGSDSEDSGSGSQQDIGVQKPRRRHNSKGKSGNETEEEENCSSEGEDNPSASKQHRQGKEKDNHSGKSGEHPSIRRLKRYIRECGVHRNYKKLFAGCRSRKAQVGILKQELENLGLKGTPSLAKCKALKQKREEAAEMASLDVNNIISTEGRPRRRNVWSLYSKSEDAPSSPEEPPIRRRATDWSCLQGVISSDGESN